VNNWWHDRFRTMNYPIENLSFEDAIDNEKQRLASGKYHIRHQSYFSKGLYDKQLKRYFKFFRREQFFIYLLEEYIEYPVQIIKGICCFLDIDESFSFKNYEEKINSQTNKNLPYKTRLKLFKKYRNSILQLEKLLDRDLSIWKI
jgi:hypothetical protein